MKFRAKATDMVCIRTFSQLLSALSRCSRNFVLRITTDKLIFVLSDKEAGNAASSISAWGEVPKDPYFCEYQMEGVSAEENQIFLEISPEKIAGCLSTLRSAHNVAGLKIKLTKKVVPCLSFEIEFQTLHSAPTCTHDVPVVLVLRKFWDQYSEPVAPEMTISIGMPDLKLVRLALERMKNVGPRLNILATNDGRLFLSVSSYNVKCTVKYGDLRVYDIRGSEEGGVHESEPMDELQEHSVEVDMKTLIHVISSDLNRPSNFILSLCGTQKIHLYYLFGELSLQYCLPCIGETV